MDLLHIPEKDTVGNLIEEWLSSDSLRLAFPEVLEDPFETDTGRRRTHRLYIRGFTALLFYLVFLVADYHMVPDIFRIALVVRLGIVLPCSVIYRNSFFIS
ncbi:hypothetical protein [Marispirochaeta sp.]|uniref:hypothetical protein n=1 Tax=Marispirochaeta sp. TaxID=2038653 RepID=UPI0029C74F7C|nr:hypothetical protein [Marispirochaeta sp.]